MVVAGNCRDRGIFAKNAFHACDLRSGRVAGDPRRGKNQCNQVKVRVDTRGLLDRVTRRDALRARVFRAERLQRAGDRRADDAGEHERHRGQRKRTPRRSHRGVGNARDAPVYR